MAKNQNTSTKSQINSKFEIQMTETKQLLSIRIEVQRRVDLKIDFNLNQPPFGCHAGLDPASRDLWHLSTGFRLAGRNDKSHSDSVKITSPEGEGFQPSPKGILSNVYIQYHILSLSFGFLVIGYYL